MNWDLSRDSYTYNTDTYYKTSTENNTSFSRYSRFNIILVNLYYLKNTVPSAITCHILKLHVLLIPTTIVLIPSTESNNCFSRYSYFYIFEKITSSWELLLATIYRVNSSWHNKLFQPKITPASRYTHTSIILKDITASSEPLLQRF